MILRELASTKSGDTARFFGLQAEESIRWLSQKGVTAATHPTVLDLGCGMGFFGQALSKVGYANTFSDDVDFIHHSIPRTDKFVDYVPRYYPEYRWIAHIPLVREFLSWNFAVMIRRTRSNCAKKSTGAKDDHSSQCL